MVSEVKVLWFTQFDKDEKYEVSSRTFLSTPNFEKTLLELLNQGWTIIASGGLESKAYVVLKRD